MNLKLWFVPTTQNTACSELRNYANPPIFIRNMRRLFSTPHKNNFGPYEIVGTDQWNLWISLNSGGVLHIEIMILMHDIYMYIVMIMIIGQEWMLGFLELSVDGYDRSRAIIIIAHLSATINTPSHKCIKFISKVTLSKLHNISLRANKS